MDSPDCPEIRWHIRVCNTKNVSNFSFSAIRLHVAKSKRYCHCRYLAPEFLMHGIVNEKTDVFAFGVLLLELITGRRALDYSQQSLVMWAKPLLKKKRIRELADPSLGDDYNLLQMNLMVLAASLCVQHSSIKRPRISQVLQLLNGNCESLDYIRKTRKPSPIRRAATKTSFAHKEKT
nr:receptor-like cytosolic serine/threonine-protein kinase RBK2 [Ipomoea batatas]